jgi:hypothetical protein
MMCRGGGIGGCWALIFSFRVLKSLVLPPPVVLCSSRLSFSCSMLCRWLMSLPLLESFLSLRSTRLDAPLPRSSGLVNNALTGAGAFYATGLAATVSTLITSRP